MGEEKKLPEDINEKVKQVMRNLEGTEPGGISNNAEIISYKQSETDDVAWEIAIIWRTDPSG